MLWIRLAWRNLFRNTRRTTLAGTVIGIGLASLMLTDALVLGMSEAMIEGATRTLLGHAQIHRKGYLGERTLEDTIADLPSLVRRLEQTPEVRDYSVRVHSPAMISSPANVGSVMLVGVDPEAESRITILKQSLVAGRYLSAEQGRGILLGEALAEDLEVEPGDRVVLTAARARSGELAQELFRVAGVFRLGSKEMDRTMAFVPLESARRLLDLAGEAHEIALRLESAEAAAQADLPLWDTLGSEENEALGWNRLAPELAAALKMSGSSSFIVGVILFAIISLGIMNTLFMSIYERMFEFGVLRAVGTRRWRLARMVLLEAGSLGLLSCAMGTLIGAGFTICLMYVGIDFRDMDVGGANMIDKIYLVPRLIQYTLFPAIVLLVTLAAALYPAWVASRITPAEAMRKSL